LRYNRGLVRNKLDEIEAELEQVRGAGRWRQLRARPGDEAALLNLGSNDYLALSTHPAVCAAGQAAAAAFGAGAGGSRLVSGHLKAHAALEAALAGMVGHAAALVFPSGYQANVATLSTLAGRGDVIFSDQLNHASLIDGARLSRAEVVVYPHGDVGALEELLAATGAARRRLIVTDSVFSMDGDIAPVAALAALAEAHDAWLVVDEAHALGVFGAGGGGVCAALGVRADVVLGTLSKALGSQGGFAAGAQPVIELLINRARPFIFSTGLSPMCVGAARAAVDLVAGNPGWGAGLLASTRAFVAALREAGLETATETQIVPVLIGEDRAAVAVGEALRARGVLAPAIRPPTVPAGTARLRLSVTRAQGAAELAAVAGLIAEMVHAERKRDGNAG